MSNENTSGDRWAEIERQARWIMEHPQDAEPRLDNAWKPRLRVWHYFSRSSGDYDAYTIFLQDRRVLVRQVSWDLTGDLQRVVNNPANTSPTIRFRDFSLPWQELHDLMEDTSLLVLGLTEEQIEFGSEFGAHGLEFINPRCSFRLYWEDAGPTAWGSVIDCYRRLMDLIWRKVEREAVN